MPKTQNKNSSKNKKYVIKKKSNKKTKNSNEDITPKEIISIISADSSKASEMAQTISVKQLEDIIQYANNKYYSGNDVISDDIYDTLREVLEERDPTSKMLDVVGADHTTTDEMEPLPYYMGSMNKIKPDSDALGNWKGKYKGPYNVSIKLDGVSGLLYIKNGTAKLFTRGRDGLNGKNISKIVPYINFGSIDLTNLVSKKYAGIDDELTLRGEMIIKKSNFPKMGIDKTKNARSIVAGATGRKTIDKKQLKYVDFVSYECLYPEHNSMSEQLSTTKDLGFNTVYNTKMSNDKVTNDSLSELLGKMRNTYDYELDGLIVTDDNKHNRNTEKNPKYALAFKMEMSDQMAEVKVLNVIWQPSKHGYLKPVVIHEKVTILGKVYQRVTAYNGKYIVDNNINANSRIKLIISGDVIPKIMEVTKQSSEPKMPEIPHEWNETHVDLIVKKIDGEKDHETIIQKNLEHFFHSIGTKNLSGGIIKSMMNSGYDSVPKILNMTIEDYMTMDRMGDTLANKLYNNINQKYNSASRLQIMVGSNCLGRGIGKRRVNPILEAYPNIDNGSYTKSQIIEMINKLEGFQTKSSTVFAENIPKYIKFRDGLPKQNKPKGDDSEEKQETEVIHIDKQLFSGKRLLLTGFRDKDIIAFIDKHGGDTSKGFNANKTDFIITVSGDNGKNKKTEKALEVGIPVLTKEEFMSKYMV
jgi:DNA ligase (NAD+)